MALVERAFGLRLASAAVLVPLALAAVWLGGVYFAALVIAAAGGMGWEWAQLTGCRGPAALPIVMAAALAGAGAGVGNCRRRARPDSDRSRRGSGSAAAGAGCPVPGWAALGTAWIALPCLACLWLAAERPGGRAAMLWLFATVWATDTAAYLAGRGIGGPLLAPLVSPKKTWSGAVGGLLGAAVVGWASARLAGGSVAVVVAAGLVLSVAAQLGDLAESFAKRRFGVKDSGALIPGHGGLLDRLDGMLTAALVQGAMTLAAGTGPLLWRV